MGDSSVKTDEPIRTIHNRWPCCNKPSGIKHHHWDDDAVLENKQCPTCGKRWTVSFEVVRPIPHLPEFRKVNWRRQNEA